MNLWRKPAVTIAGGVLVLVGIVLLVIPGPGLLTIAAGVAIWATEYAWAARLLQRVRARLNKRKTGPPDKLN
jgi:uncharacterized protein (TIGR02611 family)